MACAAPEELDNDSTENLEDSTVDRSSMPRRSALRGMNGQAARRKMLSESLKVTFSSYDDKVMSEHGRDCRHVCEDCRTNGYIKGPRLL